MGRPLRRVLRGLPVIAPHKHIIVLGRKVCTHRTKMALVHLSCVGFALDAGAALFGLHAVEGFAAPVGKVSAFLCGLVCYLEKV